MLIYCAKYDDIRASLAVRLLLKRAVRDKWDMELPLIAREQYGKPYFPEFQDRFFSLSHTKQYVLCAVSDHPVGADIEMIRPVSDALKARVCGDEELRAFDFFELWTLKESYIKLRGRLYGRLRDNTFKRNGGQIITPSENVSAALYSPVFGWQAAVCSDGEPPPDNLVFLDTPLTSNS